MLHNKTSDFKDMAIKLFGKTIQLEPEEHEQNRDPSAEVTDDKNDTTTCSGIESSKEEDESSSTLQDKALKKLDKILPCPRCNSSETKFCYYNNYNVNQPRHFCKKCQRYWTAGGSMRNVPVGAGRRKSKTSSASRYHQFIVPEAIQAVDVNAATGIRNLGSGSNSTVLSFGPNCESVASMLTLSEKKSRFHRLDRFSDNGSNCKRVPPRLSCFGRAISPYKINSETPRRALPAPFYPSRYWSCNMPTTRPVAIQPRLVPSSTPPSPLGKHSREGQIINPANTETSSTNKSTSLVPKTLTIEDPSEAANSSIWTTLNINSQNSISVNEGSLFNGFHTKMEDKNYTAEASAVLQANPAALMRSINFHERSI